MPAWLLILYVYARGCARVCVSSNNVSLLWMCLVRCTTLSGPAVRVAVCAFVRACVRALVWWSRREPCNILHLTPHPAAPSAQSLAPKTAWSVCTRVRTCVRRCRCRCRRCTEICPPTFHTPPYAAPPPQSRWRDTASWCVVDIHIIRLNWSESSVDNSNKP